MSFILITGNAVLDIVNGVDHYPQEDEEMRASNQWVGCGGNAANTARVLAAHRHRCDWAGVLATNADGERIANSLQAAGVGLEHASRQAGTSPVSCITLNQANGSRTIVHYRDLPELSAADFCQIPVERYDWLHFEGRNVAELEKMLAYTRDNIFDQPVSLEIEKQREGLAALIPLVDLVMFPRAYAQLHGFSDAESFLRDQQAKYGSIWMTCTWGEQGAWAIDQLGVVFHAPALKVEQVVDTTGSGDVFNAGLIHALATGQLLEEALHYATELAGRKVAQQGLEGLM
ncbi:MAG TPA: PfkB family carbohydrate kinase [Candidatus Thiothrix moscowensis]|uniref:PfkB family carbohydrate kinase n=1 Tax=unclassified Thiothrix TaxID=2636184 RepID=UPI0025F567AD|nr:MULTISPECIES: PfkB family carbohydrate kinase [unclassified Thiothrix]HRJ53596.1 PfkB family carbohydrate kinase [Candidatus Thiothrix moscowensis]HRJ93596.1 PfkB family carbohydrate kinase [Candidatus Thiothrix moscowensis]